MMVGSRGSVLYFVSASLLAGKNSLVLCYRRFFRVDAGSSIANSLLLLVAGIGRLGLLFANRVLTATSAAAGQGTSS